MAFRASELRLILGIQAYGTTNLTRLRRDIAALGREANLANANQIRNHDQIVAKRAQVAGSQRRVADMEARMAARRSTLDAQSMAAAQRLASRRSTLAQREMVAANTIANRHLQIGKQRDRIAAMGGSGMQRFAVQEATLGQRRLGIENQIGTLERNRIGLQAQGLRNRAGEIAASRRLFKEVQKVVPDEAAGARLHSQLLAQPARIPKAFDTPGLREATLRYRAVLKDAEKIRATQNAYPKQIAALNQQLQIVAEQEKLIGMRRTEQAAAIGRANEMLGVQQGALSAIEERLAQIRVEQVQVAEAEGMTTTQREAGLAALRAQAAAIEVEKIKTIELMAEEERLATIREQEAIARDAANVRAGKAQRLEAAGRTVAHIGRTAQFAGLIGTAGFAAAAAAAADFNKKAQLAGTQMRDVGANFQQGTRRGAELQAQILKMMEVFPAGAQDMADSAYEIFSSMNLVHDGVVNVTKGYQLMRVANKIAVAGQVDLNEATSALIVTLNNFDPNLQHVGKTMNEVFAIVRFGQMRLSDFADAMVPLAPIAKTTGLQLKDVGAALATLTILFKSPRQAAQGLARAIELLNLDPFRIGLEKLHVHVLNPVTGKMNDLHTIIKGITRAFPEAATSQRAMVRVLTDISKASGLTKAGIQGTVQARRALAGLITSMGLYENILQNIKGDQHEFNDAFDAMKNTPGVQWAIFINQMKAFALTIGQAALPVMLRFGQWLVNAAHWIEDMIKKTDGAAVRWAAFGAIALLVGGTLMNLAGSAIALVANLRLATMSLGMVEGSAVKANIAVRLLSASMSILAGIGLIAIPIVLQIMKGGEPGLWDFLGAAVAGAGGGALIGGGIGTLLGGPGLGTAIGAGIGAITVPVAVEVISHFQAPDPSTVKPVKAAYQSYLKHALSPGETVMDFSQFQRQFNANIKKFKIPEIGEDVAHKGQVERSAGKAKTLLDKYKDYVKQFTKAQLDAQQAYLDSLTKGDTKGAQAASLAKKHAGIVSDAFKQMQQEVKQDVDKLGGVYDKFLQMNQAAFGEVFQGPVLSGFMGDIFKNINDLLMQFGESIPVPIQIIQNDLDVQMKNFDKLRQGYADLVKKGVPPEVMQQIQTMGMAGLPFVQGLLKASGPQFAKWLQGIKKSHKDIVKATQIDFSGQLAQWKKYGSDIATKMIDGLSSDAAQATIKGGFDKYVMQIFGKTLRENMAKTIATNMQAAMQEAAAANAAADKTKKGAKAGVTAAERTRNLALGLNADGSPKVPSKTTMDKVPKTKTTVPKAPSKLPGSFAGYIAGLPSATVTSGKPAPQLIVNNHGDQITVHADGVHPNNVVRAFNKKGFERRNKRRGR